MYVVTICFLSPFYHTREIRQQAFIWEDDAVNWFCEQMESEEVVRGRGRQLSMIGAVATSGDELRENGWNSHNGGPHNFPSVIGTIRFFR